MALRRSLARRWEVPGTRHARRAFRKTNGDDFARVCATRFSIDAIPTPRHEREQGIAEFKLRPIFGRLLP